MKRAGAFMLGGAPSGKVPKPPDQQSQGPKPEQGECWTCRDCGNENWPLRSTCNKRGCGAPGPWTCPACQNKNFQGRDTCNRRTCGQPRPGAASGCGKGGCKGGMGMPQGAQLHQMSMLSGVDVQTLQKIMAIQAGMGVMPGGPAATAASSPPAGSWACSGCGNINWPLRSSCNNKQCQMPRSQADQPMPAITVGGGGGKGGGGKGETPPDGSWVCAGCKNVNWPLRSTCNKKGCGLAREQADIGPPDPTPGIMAGGQPGGQQGEPPEGAWACLACNNVNWPLRTTCNKRGCGQPRHF